MPVWPLESATAAHLLGGDLVGVKHAAPLKNHLHASTNASQARYDRDIDSIFKREVTVMAEIPTAPKPESSVVFGVTDIPHAPFIYYDAAPAIGVDNGVINITLSAHREYVGPNKETITEPIVVAYLRGTIPAARFLRDALNRALSAA
jgi:hypothetical protein